MYCKNCGGELDGKQSVCLQCGVPVGEGSEHCAVCGSRVVNEAVVCVNCGAATRHTQQSAPKQDKVVLALLCFFLGAWGVHNFMMGENKKGIVKIALYFCCGVSGILALIDFIRILTDSYVVDTEKYI